ncbi:hypothetical protein NNO07_11140 [Pseudomonas resinovorans]|uniref:Uncharacterized protein n=1 Tax=Metapseudomonas resinovorans TaxID=53412 RepID=A0ABT4Y446_METRE|nr:hypothetical protein [Pseudomonas resinovorans]MDA8483627.1 hypothetical protein [Pseudomonas resinovorans]
MGLNRTTQRLRRELLDLACHQEALASKLTHIAETLPAAQSLLLLELLAEVYADVDHLKALAEEVRQGQVSRLKS